MAPIFTRVELLISALVWLTRLYCGGACISAQYEESQKKHKNNDLAVITKEYDYVFWFSDFALRNPIKLSFLARGIPFRAEKTGFFVHVIGPILNVIRSCRVVDCG